MGYKAQIQRVPAGLSNSAKLSHTVTVSSGFQWTSSGSLANGTTVPACPGQDVTLAWSYTAVSAEHLNNVEWHYTPTGGSPVVLATMVMGTFFEAPGLSQQLQFIPNAGIRIQNVDAKDSGTYSVHVNLDLHGSIVREVQVAEVEVSDKPLTTDGQLHVEMLSVAAYDNATGEFHVQLSCGHFLPVWQGSRVAVVWRTPTVENVPSTSYENGRFLLSIPNPVASGEYTCTVDNSSPASLCVQRDSPLERGATIGVDGVRAQLVFLDSRMRFMQQREDQMMQQLNSYEQKNTNLESLLSSYQTQMSNYQTQLNSTQEKNEELETQLYNYQIQLSSIQQKNAELESQFNSLQQDNIALRNQQEAIFHNLTSSAGSTQGVAFHVESQEAAYNPGAHPGHKLTYTTVRTNVGNAFSTANSVFTAPVDGTYIFFLTIAYDEPIDGRSYNIDAGLYVDNVRQCEVYIRYDTHEYDNYCHAIVSLRKGQQVDARNDINTVHLLPRSRFSGALLHVGLS